MAQITSLYVHKVIAQTSAGVEVRDLVEALGLVPDDPIDPGKMVASDDYYRFFAEIAQRDPKGIELPLKIGSSMRIDEYGAFGLAWKSAPNLRGSFSRSERYGQVLGNAERYTLEDASDGLFFRLDKAGERSTEVGLGMALSNEASMAAVASICDEVSVERITPLEVHFQHTARGDPAIYERHFGCPVRFEAGRNALLIDPAALETPNTLGDETIARFFDRHLEAELARMAPGDGLEQRVSRVIIPMLSEGVPTVSRVADELAMSARTLQRRLADGDQSYQGLVDAARRDLARKLLRETDYSLAEVAFLTGFAEQSGFSRAFKRWQGQTPRSYRLRVT
ncbi:MAG: AraC family transcriptional regulator [Erythrobacter sp.]|nr:AraC family transcriptional regulator [Erythrobacter sp.]